jgi:hypothetical protein
MKKMKEKYNYPTTALLSKSQSIRLKEYADSQGMSVSKILRRYVDIICPPPTGEFEDLSGLPENYHNKAIKDIMDTIIPDAVRNRVDWKNSPTIAVHEEYHNAVVKQDTWMEKLKKHMADIEPQNWAQKYWCRVCADHVDIYTTTGEDKKCKVCDNYVIGG